MDGEGTRYDYDNDGNCIRIHYADGGIERRFYDATGNMIKQVLPESYNADADDGDGYCYAYDKSGNMTQIKDPDGNVLHTYEYNGHGQAVRETDGEGQEKLYTDNGLGLLIKEQSSARTEGETVYYRVTAYTYDRQGNNSMGQVCQVTDQEGCSEYFYYDEEGRPETRIDRNGNMETTHYNIDGSLLYKRAEDKKGRNPVVSRYMYYPDGKLKEAAGGGITYHYAYTENGLLKSKSASGKKLLEYAYDRNNNLSCLTDSTGKSIHYTYDTMDRLEQVAEGQGDVLASYSYNRAGGIHRLHYGNGIQTEYKYKDDGNLSSLMTVTGQGQVILNFDYAYDGNGNCIRKSGGQYRNEYVYDRMNRLTKAVQDGKAEQYTYKAY